MNITIKIDNDIKTAMKAKDVRSLTALRMLKSALTNTAIEKKIAVGEMPGMDVCAVIRKEIKKRKDSVESFTFGGRLDMAANEAAEIIILSNYLPVEITPEKLNEVIAESITELNAKDKKQIGAVVKLVMSKTAGSADGRTVSGAVSKILV